MLPKKIPNRNESSIFRAPNSGVSQVLSEEDTKRILLIDASQVAYVPEEIQKHKLVDCGVVRGTNYRVSQDVKVAAHIDNKVKWNYFRANLSLYDMAISLWLDALKYGCNPRQRAYFLVHPFWIDAFVQTLAHDGLLETIKAALEFSDRLINQEEISQDGSIWSQYLYYYQGEVSDLSGALASLRFLKRFSPQKTDHLHQAAAEAFLLTEKRLRALDKRNSVSFWTPMDNYIRYIILDILGTTSITLDNGLFGDGAVSDALKSKASKLQKAEEHYPMILQSESVKYAPGLYKPKGITYNSKFITVPKSFKARRPIAMEESGRQFFLQAIRKDLEAAVTRTKYYSEECITFDNQSPNQERAMLGSRDRSYATIDLSQASDSLRMSLVNSFFPLDVSSALNVFRAKYCLVEGKRIKLSKAATSGSAACFPIETILFFAIAMCGTQWAADREGKDWELTDVSSFGDDICCPNWAAPYVISLLEHYGFITNSEKTHYDSEDSYRESCGEEYYDGEPISMYYFTRTNLDLLAKRDSSAFAKTYSALIDMQHHFSYHPILGMKIAQYIKDLCPFVTESQIGSEYQDLWFRNPRVKLENGKRSDDYQRPVEVHTSLSQWLPNWERRDDALVYNAVRLAYEQMLKRPNNKGSLPLSSPFVEKATTRYGNGVTKTFDLPSTPLGTMAYAVAPEIRVSNKPY